MTSTTAPQRNTGSPLRMIGDRISALFQRPLANYYIILSIVGLLVLSGILMVVASSMTWSLVEGSGVWGSAVKQMVMVVIGLTSMWVMLWLPPGVVRRFSYAAMLFTILLLGLVLIPGIGTGREEVGSQSWIVVGPLRLQPSEVARVMIAVWGAHFFSRPNAKPTGPWNDYIVYSVYSGVIACLIALEGDLGMTVTFSSVVIAMLFFAGVKKTYMFTAAATIVIGALGMVIGTSFRNDRFTVYFDALLGHFEDTADKAYQSYQGFLSLSDGSLTGVGIGQSRAKWFYLPEARNDFVFAVLGEEWGFVGGAIIIVLFACLLFFGMRTAAKNSNRFLALAAATLATGVSAQAFVNIGYVIGLLPVTGIQLPMISAGGTSAIITLASMGLLANCARHEPEAISAMQSYGRPPIDRLLGLKEPSLEGLSPKAPIFGNPADKSRFGERRMPPPPPKPQKSSSVVTRGSKRESFHRSSYVVGDQRNTRGNQGLEWRENRARNTDPRYFSGTAEFGNRWASESNKYGAGSVGDRKRDRWSSQNSKDDRRRRR
ncbi:FtsW/RodA/SpoVE family cell cycle protein [Corynebacterium pseudotuberculosis]|uniref:FtsW/RodA/SpoVE family cell cycle protein n=1 Tax=Corynebacterium pseudotuberculosis TaxID=1719 RepID=UPI00059D726A|nr:putative peptidoglycan glycosyltransferase FtsW [Corynebacterium pseudotuberculosis]AFM07725.2 cell division protein [Corynebacterium pseudotuberculosis Cp162]APG81956.1 Cell division protein ftsW [Corynebacterium pseudotuberculosis]WFP66546.1 putative peptidoglycan glycosyltransferase FtsW [Corynebacterium pseudotuberculosis]